MKDLLGSIAVILTFIAFVPYIYSIIKGKTRPHIFTWVIWSISVMIIFFAALKGKSGAGAWAIGISALIYIFIVILSYYKKSDKYITRRDIILLIIAISAIPIYYIFIDPLWSVILLVSIIFIGYLPTISKTYRKPETENITLYAIMFTRNLLIIFAIENYNLANLLFPIISNIGNMILIFILLVKRGKKMDKEYK